MALLLHQQGYAATGINQMLAESAAPRGSMYFHFRDGKRQLAAEAIAFGSEATARVIERVLGSTDDTAAAVDALVELLGRRLAQSDWQLGSVLATVTLETAAVDERLADACRNGFQSWTDLLRRQLAKAGIPEPDASDLATLVVATLEGGLILARAARSLRPLEQIRRHVSILLHDARPASHSPQAAGPCRATGVSEGAGSGCTGTTDATRPDAEAVSQRKTDDALSRWRHGFESRWWCSP